MASFERLASRMLWFDQVAALLAECTCSEPPVINVHGTRLNLADMQPDNPVQTAIDILLAAHEPDFMRRDRGLTRVDAFCACRTCAPTYRRLALLTCP